MQEFSPVTSKRIKRSTPLKDTPLAENTVARGRAQSPQRGRRGCALLCCTEGAPAVCVRGARVIPTTTPRDWWYPPHFPAEETEAWKGFAETKARALHPPRPKMLWQEKMHHGEGADSGKTAQHCRRPLKGFEFLDHESPSTS